MKEDAEKVLSWADRNHLRLNVTKTLLGRKKREEELNGMRVTMGEQEIQRSRSVKCLGVVLDDCLTWREQIESVRRKCFAGLAKIRRWSQVLPMKAKKELYNALVLPYLDYCSIVWQECSKEQVQRLERVQNYGMRIILSKPPRTNSEEMRRELKWRTLDSRRNMRRLGLMYRCVHRQTTRLLSSRFEAKKGKCTRGALRLFLRRANTEFYRRSFSFRGVQDWNNLPEEVRTLSSLESFKSRLNVAM